MQPAHTTQKPRHGASLEVFPDQNALSRAAAEGIATAARAAVGQAGRFTIALSGGPAPGPVFDVLSGEEPFRSEFPWEHTHFFWGDERHVPPEHPKSNYWLAYDHLLSKAPIPEENVHRVRAELPDAHDAADLYDAALRDFFQAAVGDFPRFDLMLQGLGDNGHTASLFPGTTALTERRRLMVATWIEKLQTHRITTTFPVLNNAATVLFVVSGRKPAAALKEVLFGPRLSVPLPAQQVAPTHGRLVWLADEEAASRL